MNLSQKNYKEVLPKELLKQAGKSNVRECDEKEKGHFQAYVDEKENSFDVSIIINNESIITEHNCDCNARIEFCRHKVALMLFLDKGKKNSTQKIKRTKKVSPAEALLEELDTQKLKDWVKSLLAKNKELELAFVHHFSEQQKEYNPATVKQLTLNAVKAVAGNRKKLEIGEVKKIVELWTEIHDAVITHYFTNVTDKESFLNFDALIDVCNEVKRKVNTNSTRLDKYIEDLLLKAIGPVHDLQNENSWDIATALFVERINVIPANLFIYYLSFLMHLHNASTNERKEKLAHKLVKEYLKPRPKEMYQSDTYTKTMFRLVNNSGLFEEYYKLFKPLRFENEYNDELIGLLIEHGQLQLAEKYCREQIAGNSREEYSLSYLGRLKEIYMIEKDNKKLSAILKELTPYTFDFTDFLSVYEQMDGDEKKKWRTKILTRAGHMSSYKNAKLFSFKLMDYEQNYKKMIEYINTNTPYSIIVQFADKMILTNKDGFLKQIINKSDNSFIPYSEEEREEDTAIFPSLLNILQKHYSINELKLIIRNIDSKGWYYRGNSFIAFMRENLKKE